MRKINSSLPKWQRRELARRDAARYFVISQSDDRPVKKRYCKTRLFLSWAVKLLVPDFLVGHPNLFDNLKTLIFHPQFRPMRMALAAWLIFSLTIGSLGLYSFRHAEKILAATLIDDTQAEFDAGVYSDTQWDGVNNWVELDATGLTNGLGNYTSDVLDAGGGASWNSFGWQPQRPTGKELPDNGGSETYYTTGNANMTSNQLLLHLNESSLDSASGGTDAGDSSGNSNDFNETGGVTPGVSGQLNSAFSFDGVDDYIRAENTSIGNIGTNNYTMSFWLKYNDTDRGYVFGKRLSGGDYIGFNVYRSFDAADGKVKLSIDFGPAEIGVSTTTGLNDNAWHHVAFTLDRSGYMKVYVDGVYDNQVDISAQSLADVTNTVNLDFGTGQVCGTCAKFAGSLDEIAFWSRELSATEVGDVYKRGALNLKFQVRSCDDSACSGETFIGPDGTSTDYYEWETTNSTASPTFSLTNVLDNRYFQYKAFFESDNASYSPELKSVTIDYTSTNSPPLTPTNTTPTDGATGQDLNPTLTGSAYSDPDEDAQQDASWQVDDDADFSTPVWTRTAGGAETSTTVNTASGTFANELSGKTELDHNTTYYWRVRYSDSVWSEYSASTSFQTNLLNAPTNSSPVDEATVVTTTPLLTASDFSDDQTGHTHSASQWLIDDDSDFSSLVYDSGETASAETYRVVPINTLNNYTTYYWKVRYKDSSGFWSDYSTATSFTIQIPETAIHVYPLFGSNTVDQGDSVSIDAQVINFSDGSPINTASATISIYNPAGSKIVSDATMSYISSSNGIYRYSYTIPSTSGSYLYEVTASSSGKFGYGAGNFEVRTIAADVSSTQTIVQSEQTAQSTARDNITEILKETESGILDTPKTAKSGNTITIKYQAQSGLTGSSGPLLNVYDASDTQRVSDQQMTEIGSTGIYQYDVTLSSEWGTGFFTILVSESTNNTSDSTQLYVGASDIASIGSDVSSIKSTVEDTNTNVDNLVGAMIVTRSTVSDASPTATSFVTALTNLTNDFYNNAVLTFTSGDLNGQTRRISDYDGSSKTITLNPALTSAPANGDAFTIVKQNVYVQQQVAEHEAAQATSRTRIEDIQTKVADIQTTVNTISSTVSSTYSLLQTVDSKIDTVDTNVDTLITNLQVVDNNVDTIVAKWGSSSASDIISDISDLQTAINNIRSSQQKGWNIILSDVGEVQTTNTYRTKLTILNYENELTDASSAPSIVIYDATRAVADSGTMTKLATGIYEYTYTVPSAAVDGVWESVVTVDVGGSADVTVQDYWEVEGAPAQVIINSLGDISVPSITANVTITNEGTTDYEYQYEYCIVSSEDNECGGGDDEAYASAAKLVSVGESWTPDLTLNISSDGTYWFKLVVYWGSETSGASAMFTTSNEEGGTASGSPTTSTTTNSSDITLQAVYDKLQEMQQELGFHGKTNTAYNDLLEVKNHIGALPGQLSQPLYKEVANASAQLNKTLKLLGEAVDSNSPGFRSLLEVSSTLMSDLQAMKNKLADLRAVSSVTQKLVEQGVGEPIVETWMTFNSVDINFLTTNPLSETKTLNFKAYLPAEVKPEHILDLDGLKINYDANADSYYVYGDITLGPGQSLTKTVKIKDIWFFEESEIEALRQQAQSLLRPLAGTQYDARGTLLESEINTLLSQILTKQQEGYRSPQDHIVAHRENVLKMKTVQESLTKLKDMVVQAGASQGIVGKVGGIQTFATWGIILAIIFGFGLLAAIIFAMWRNQTMMAAAAMGMGQGQIAQHMGSGFGVPRVAARQGGMMRAVSQKATWARYRAGQQIRSKTPDRIAGAWDLPWKKITIWFVATAITFALGILIVKFMPQLSKKMNLEIKENKSATNEIPEAEEKTPAPSGKDKNFQMSFSGQKETSVTTTGPNDSMLKVKETPTGWLNVRAEASLGAGIITKVYSGQQYEYKKEENNWYYVLIPKGQSGWIFGDYVQKL